MGYSKIKLVWNSERRRYILKYYNSYIFFDVKYKQSEFIELRHVLYRLEIVDKYNGVIVDLSNKRLNILDEIIIRGLNH